MTRTDHSRGAFAGESLRATLHADMWHSCAMWQSSTRYGRAARVAAKLLSAPRIRAIVLVRLSELAFERRWTRPFAVLLANRVLHSTGADIHPGARLGPGLNLAHTPGIVIGRYVRAGRDLIVFQGVTIGDGGGPGDAQPVLGDGVRLGAGAKILGDIVVGDGVVVGANAVVIRDVAAGLVVGGVPARPLGDSHEPTP